MYLFVPNVSSILVLLRFNFIDTFCKSLGVLSKYRGERGDSWGDAFLLLFLLPGRDKEWNHFGDSGLRGDEFKDRDILDVFSLNLCDLLRNRERILGIFPELDNDDIGDDDEGDTDDDRGLNGGVSKKESLVLVVCGVKSINSLYITDIV